MKFGILKLLLWLKGGVIRELVFESNKINVITGDSNTGKTTILDIVDYCFFASKPKIAESIINENTLWYGLLLSVNDKSFTIARGALIKGKPSSQYYFSSAGEIPDEPIANNSEDSLKRLFEAEFSIDNSVSIPYGGNYIRAGSKISLRYFMMFNTISANIIENDSNVFFDKQNESRYREALPRIFDLALGIETIENVLKKEKKAELEKQIARFERRASAISAKSRDFERDQRLIIKKAKEYQLIDSKLDFNSSWQELRGVVSGMEIDAETESEREHLERQKFSLSRKIANLKRFSLEYSSYKERLACTADSLAPIDFLKEKSEEVIKTSIFYELISSLSEDLASIRDHLKRNRPIESQVNDIIRSYEGELEGLKKSLSILPETNKSFAHEREKYLFIGELKAKMALYSDSSPEVYEVCDSIPDIEEKLSLIHVDDTENRKDLTIKLIEEIIAEYISLTASALENYGTYRPVFDYKSKSLSLRKPKTSFVEHIGSSSNHMFMHLFFSLAMQEVAGHNESPFVAPYLIIDQPSRPYYGDDDVPREFVDHSDEAKIKKAFHLLDRFMTNRIGNGGGFQMIVFEKIPKRLIQDLENIHILEEFAQGNALIPHDYLASLDGGDGLLL